MPFEGCYPNPVAGPRWAHKGGSYWASQRCGGQLSIAVSLCWPQHGFWEPSVHKIIMLSGRLVLSEDSCLGSCTPGAGRYKGRSEAIIVCVCVLSRGELKYNFHADHIMDYGLGMLCQRPEGSLFLPERMFSSAGVEGNERKRKAAPCIFWFWFGMP